jgi:hypothetical protein
VESFDDLPGVALDLSVIAKSFKTNSVAISYTLTRPCQLSIDAVTFEHRGPVSVEFDYGREFRILISKEQLAMLRQNNISRASQIVGGEILKTPPDSTVE